MSASFPVYVHWSAKPALVQEKEKTQRDLSLLQIRCRLLQAGRQHRILVAESAIAWEGGWAGWDDQCWEVLWQQAEIALDGPIWGNSWAAESAASLVNTRVGDRLWLLLGSTGERMISYFPALLLPLNRAKQQWLWLYRVHKQWGEKGPGHSAAPESLLTVLIVAGNSPGCRQEKVSQSFVNEAVWYS